MTLFGKVCLIAIHSDQERQIPSIGIHLSKVWKSAYTIRMHFIYILTASLLVLSLVTHRGKTLQALKVGLRRFLKVAPPFLVMLAAVSMALVFIPEERLVQLLGKENRWMAAVTAMALGSVSIMPGFIAFPLCGFLLSRGALYMVLSAFSTSVMMVGVVTFPLERAYLGTRLAVVRNIGSLLIALAVALATGLLFGELW